MGTPNTDVPCTGVVPSADWPNEPEPPPPMAAPAPKGDGCQADGIVVLPKADVAVVLPTADGVIVLPNADVPPNTDCSMDVLPTAGVVALPNADVVAVEVEAPFWLASRAGKLLCLTACSYAWVRLERAFWEIKVS